MLIDTHLHLADSKFDVDREAAIQRARDADVSLFIEIAESPASWEPAIALAEKYSFIYASLGIHPHHAHEVVWRDVSARLRGLLKHPKVVAIGEFGLDYFRMQNTRDQQDVLFRGQLELAQELQKPVVIHCRDDAAATGTATSAHADVQKLLAQVYPQKSFAVACPLPAGVIHCFSGTWEQAQTYMSHGFMLGFDAPVTYPSSKRLQEIVLRMPVQRMVLETDAPYLPPQTHRGQRNEPAYLPATAETIGAIKRKAIGDIAHQTTANAKALFRLNDV